MLTDFKISNVMKKKTIEKIQQSKVKNIKDILKIVYKFA